MHGSRRELEGWESHQPALGQTTIILHKRRSKKYIDSEEKYEQVQIWWAPTTDSTWEFRPNERESLNSHPSFLLKALRTRVSWHLQFPVLEKGLRRRSFGSLHNPSSERFCDELKGHLFSRLWTIMVIKPCYALAQFSTFVLFFAVPFSNLLWAQVSVSFVVFQCLPYLGQGCHATLCDDPNNGYDGESCFIPRLHFFLFLWEVEIVISL